MGIDICGDYWGIVNKAIGALETELDILKKKKSFEIQKETLLKFIEINKDYLEAYDVGVVSDDSGGYESRRMYSIGCGDFYDNVGRKFYKMTDSQLYNWDPISVRYFELTISEEGINIILKFIERRFEDYINKLGL